jgi:hypothetical protein
MVCFLTKNPNLGKFWRVLHWKILVYFVDTWSIHFTVFCYMLWTFGIVCGNLVYFPPFWYFVERKIWQPWCRRRLSMILRNENQPFKSFLCFPPKHSGHNFRYDIDCLLHRRTHNSKLTQWSRNALNKDTSWHRGQYRIYSIFTCNK